MQCNILILLLRKIRRYFRKIQLEHIYSRVTVCNLLLLLVLLQFITPQYCRVSYVYLTCGHLVINQLPMLYLSMDY